MPLNCRRIHRQLKYLSESPIKVGTLTAARGEPPGLSPRNTLSSTVQTLEKPRDMIRPQSKLFPDSKPLDFSRIQELLARIQLTVSAQRLRRRHHAAARSLVPPTTSSPSS
jgi:hypothetical protein